MRGFGRCRSAKQTTQSVTRSLHVSADVSSVRHFLLYLGMFRFLDYLSQEIFDCHIPKEIRLSASMSSGRANLFITSSPRRKFELKNSIWWWSVYQLRQVKCGPSHKTVPTVGDKRPCTGVVVILYKTMMIDVYGHFCALGRLNGPSDLRRY